MNKEGIEIMSDINLEIQELTEELVCVKEELEMEKEENELYIDYLDVADAEEAKRKFENMKKQIAELERKNKILQESSEVLVKDNLKLHMKLGSVNQN